MATLVKRHRSKAARIVGIALFVMLMFVNVKLTTDPYANGDINLLGVKISLYTPSAYAKTEDLCAAICDDANNGYCTYLVSYGYCFGHWN